MTGHLMIVLAGALVHQEPDPRLQARLDSATGRAVAEVLDSARAAGLPTEPLVQKALEGRAKGAPSARIVAAVNGLWRGLGAARVALGDRAGSDELQAGALWLRAGGDTGSLARFRRAGGARGLVVALAVSTELLVRGWSAGEATGEVERLLIARVSDDGFLSLRSAVEAAVRNGAAIGIAARSEAARLAPRGRP